MEIQYLETSSTFSLTDAVLIDFGEQDNAVISVSGKGSYFFFPKKEGKYTRKFEIASGSTFSGSAIFLGANIESKLTTNIIGDAVDSVLSLLVLAEETKEFLIEGVASVDKPYRDVKVRVDQHNILLGEGPRKVMGKPVLEIATDDIEGGHSCRIERIGGEAMFYFESHGIDHKIAEGMLLESTIKKHLINIIDTDITEEIYKEILGKLGIFVSRDENE